MAITKRKLLTVFKSQSEVARKLGLDAPAVSKWPMDKPIPEKHELRLRYVLMPEIRWDENDAKRA